MKCSPFTESVLSVLLAICTGIVAKGDEQWPQFRGPNGDGHSVSTGLPLEVRRGQHGMADSHSRSRLVLTSCLGRSDLVTTATREGDRLFAVCVDKNTGAIVFDKLVFQVESPVSITLDNTYATPTPVIEEGRIYVHFGSYGTACMDTKSGEILWSRRDLQCDHEKGAGPASSPMLIDDLLVFHVDGAMCSILSLSIKRRGRLFGKRIVR